MHCTRERAGDVTVTHRSPALPEGHTHTHTPNERHCPGAGAKRDRVCVFVCDNPNGVAWGASEGKMEQTSHQTGFRGNGGMSREGRGLVLHAPNTHLLGGEIDAKQLLPRISSMAFRQTVSLSLSLFLLFSSLPLVWEMQ